MPIKLNWRNIETNTCPYCSGELEKPNREGMILCSECYFVIDHARFNSMLRFRRELIGGVRMHWQNLKRCACPVCDNDLIETGGGYEVLKCTGIGCVFHIRQDRLDEILSDPNHPANRYSIDSELKGNE